MNENLIKSTSEFDNSIKTTVPIDLSNLNQCMVVIWNHLAFINDLYTQQSIPMCSSFDAVDSSTLFTLQFIYTLLHYTDHIALSEDEYWSSFLQLFH